MLLMACTEETPPPAQQGGTLQAELQWLTSRSNISSPSQLPENVALIRAIISDASGTILRDLDGKLLDRTEKRGQGYLWFSRLYSGTNLTLEVRGYDNDSHLVYQQREDGITILQNKITDLGPWTMKETDTVAPFDTRLIELTTNEYAGITNVQLSARDNWGISCYYISTSPNRPALPTSSNLCSAPWKNANGERYFSTIENVDLGLDLDREIISAVETVPIYVWFVDEPRPVSERRISLAQRMDVVINHGDDALPSDLTINTSWSNDRNSSYQSSSNNNLLIDLSAVDDYGLTAYLLSDNVNELTPAIDDPYWEAIARCPEQANKNLVCVTEDNLSWKDYPLPPKEWEEKEIEFEKQSGNQQLRFWVQDTGGQIRSSSSLTINGGNAAPRILKVVLNQDERTTSTRSVRLDISAVDDQNIHSYYVSQSTTVPTSSSNWAPTENRLCDPTKPQIYCWTGHFTLPTNSSNWEPTENRLCDPTKPRDLTKPQIYCWTGHFTDQNSSRGLQEVHVWVRDNNYQVSDKATATIDYIPEPGFEHQVCLGSNCGLKIFEPSKNYSLRIALTGEPADDVPIVVSTDSEKLFDNATSSIARHTFQQETWSSVWELNFTTPANLSSRPALIYLDFTVNNPVAHDYEYSRLGQYILNTLNY